MSNEKSKKTSDTEYKKLPDYDQEKSFQESSACGSLVGHLACFFCSPCIVSSCFSKSAKDGKEKQQRNRRFSLDLTNNDVLGYSQS